MSIVVRQARITVLSQQRLLGSYFVSAADLGREIERFAMCGLLHKASQETGWIQLWAEGEEGQAGLLVIEPKPWDSALLGTETKTLFLLASGPSEQSRHGIGSHLIDYWLQNWPAKAWEYIVTRIPADDVPLQHALEMHGFRTLVPMVTLAKKVDGKCASILPSGMEIVPVGPSETPQVEEIAATAFVYGRFYVDPGIPRQASARLHATWARNCCVGLHADYTLVVRHNGHVRGFIAMKRQQFDELAVGAIDLIAVSEASRGMGLGRALVRAGCNWTYSFSRDVIVRTELPNASSLRLYESEGFRTVNGSVYLSLWRRSGSR